MTTPVSWLLIEPGWRVEDAAGDELGHVEEVTGDSEADIFDGLSVSAGALDRPKYVPAEQVGEIVEGRVRLKLDGAAFAGLGAFEEPPVQEEIEPTGASLSERARAWFGRAGRR